MHPVPVTAFAEVADSLPPARGRSRRPFHPSRHVDPVYRLPPAIADRLEPPYKAAGRPSGPIGSRSTSRGIGRRLRRSWRLSRSRRGASTEPADLVAVLDMTAAEIRGALKALEDVGFVVREIGKGNGFQPTAAGLRKAPIRFRFGPDYWPLFKAANTRRTNSHRGRGFAPKIASRRDSAGPSLAASSRPLAPRA